MRRWKLRSLDGSKHKHHHKYWEWEDSRWRRINRMEANDALHSWHNFLTALCVVCVKSSHISMRKKICEWICFVYAGTHSGSIDGDKKKNPTLSLFWLSQLEPSFTKCSRRHKCWRKNGMICRYLNYFLRLFRRKQRKHNERWCWHRNTKPSTIRVSLHWAE